VLVGKYIAYLACTILVVLPSVVIVYFVAVPFRDIAATFPLLLTDLGLLALGLAVYGALFAWSGTVLRRPLVAGLVFAFGWEQVALLMPGYLRRLTVAYYLQALVPHAMPSDSIASVLQAVVTDTPSPVACIVWLLFALAVLLVLARRAVERREYVLEQ